jgi:hypothetical protein
MDSTLMTVGDGLQMEINTPKAIKDKGDSAHALPPHALRPVYLVERYRRSPENWMRGGPRISSYFMKTKEGLGMWLDFNGCGNHKHHVAAVTTIQGVNPITGQRTTGTGMEQYRENCPVHETPFGPDNWCSQCEYKWPPQNYLATTGTPAGQFWLDGFRSANGEVRQYVFTEEEMRGVAAQVIGNDRVAAIAVAFYISKEPKPPQPTYVGCGGLMMDGLKTHHLIPPPQHDYPVLDMTYYPHTTWGDTYTSCQSASGPKPGQGSMQMRCASDPQLKGILRSTGMSLSVESPVVDESSYSLMSDVESGDNSFVAIPKILEVAAGARIHQYVHKDPETLEFWNPEPAGVIYVAYCDEATFKDIKGSEIKDRGSFLSNVKVGNP